MSLFDGVTGLFEGVFDCTVTIARPNEQPRDERGIFREEPGVQDDLDGVEVFVNQPVLKLRRPAAGDIARGHFVTIETKPGITYTVLTVQPGRSPATDGHVLVILSEGSMA